MRHLFAAATLAVLVHLAAAPPNIVVYLADDHGRLDSSVYGNEFGRTNDARTPNMQRLADAGLTFNNAFVASPSCAPSRAAMLTGLYPARNGAQLNHTYARQNIPRLTNKLRELGYEAVAFGKIGHQFPRGSEFDRAGFDQVIGEKSAAAVKAFLDQRQSEKPLALFVGDHDPHVPWPELAGYVPSQLHLEPTDLDTPETRELRGRYYTGVTRMDSNLGNVFDLVNEKLGRENLLFLYTSDHGAQWPFAKWNLYDAGIRVPMIVVWPGVTKPGTRTDAQMSWLDILPTFIDAAGGDAPAEIDGKSFLHVIRDPSQSHRDVIFTTHEGDGKMNSMPMRSLRADGFKYIRNLYPNLAFTTHSDIDRKPDAGAYWTSWLAMAELQTPEGEHARQVVTRYHKRPAEELYDLKNDPYETKNLAADPAHADRLLRMRNAVSEWMKTNCDDGELKNTPHPLSELGLSYIKADQAD